MQYYKLPLNSYGISVLFKDWLDPYFDCDYIKLTQNTDFNQSKIIQQLFGPVFFGAAGSKAEGNISYNYRSHILTNFTS